MIQHVFSSLCSSSSIDEETNRISLFNILENLTILSQKEEKITLPIEYEVFSLWTREDPNVAASGKTRILFCNHQDSCVKQSEIEIDLITSNNCRTRMKSFGLHLNGSGRYKFVVELSEDNGTSWKKITELPLDVNYQSLPEGEIQN